MPAESMEMPQMNNMVAQPQTEQPKAEEPMSMGLRGGGALCECCECCACCCASEALCCFLCAEETVEVTEE